MPIATIAALIVLTVFSCKKINEATDIGSDLIPVVDNVTTFETFLPVETYTDVFSAGSFDDSTRLGPTEEHFLGTISNDPIFGKTQATIYMQLKPTFYPYNFSFKSIDSLIALDSVVMVLGYKETYGDTTVQQGVNVYELAQGNDFRYDSGYNLRSTFTDAQFLASKTFFPSDLNDSIHLQKSTVLNQLRIPMPASFGNRLIHYDTLSTGTNNAFRNDSLFNTFLKGFAIRPTGTGNAIIGIDLTASSLVFYYRMKSNGLTDTTSSTFAFRTDVSANANNIVRTRSGSQMGSFVGSSTPSNLAFIQNTPGSYITVKIPGLDTLSNKIVHRAELIAQQVYDVTDTLFPPPDFIFLDAYDSANSRYRLVPYDAGFDVSGNLNADAFGMVGMKATDPNGKAIKVWRFNLSRYIQHRANHTEPSYSFRMFAARQSKAWYGTGSSQTLQFFYINPNVAKGRVRLGGGNHATQPMRLRIVYSKI